MMYSKRGGGLVLEPETLRASGPIGRIPDVSWLGYAMPGDDQGEDGACVLFAFASAAEIMHGVAISDQECTELYRRVLKDKGRPAGAGMTFLEGWEYAAPWFPGATGISFADIGNIVRGPLLGGYSITSAWDQTNDAGCLDHEARGPSRGGHAVVIAAVGVVDRFDSLGRCVYIENSWGRQWGKDGIGVMTESLHGRMCNQMWEINRDVL